MTDFDLVGIGIGPEVSDAAAIARNYGSVQKAGDR